MLDVATSVRDLERAVEAPEIVRALKGYGLTQQEIGAIAGVSDRAVRQWSQAGIKPARYDRLIEVREIALLLSDSLSPRGVGQWLHAKNRLLHSERRPSTFSPMAEAMRYEWQPRRSSTAPTFDDR